LLNFVSDVYVSGKSGNEAVDYYYICITEEEIVLTFMWCGLEHLNDVLLLQLQCFKFLSKIHS